VKVTVIPDRTHNSFDEAHWVSCLRENLTSSSYGEGLETGRASTQTPRQSFTRQVYFKEAKQHLGFLREQSNHYAAYVASIHLSAIRFCLLSIAQFAQQARGVSDIRKRLSNNVHQISFATQLWSVFRAVITGALDELKILLGDAVTLIMETIECHVQRFFVQALQLDPQTLRLEAK
jgi:hypothetical protein